MPNKKEETMDNRETIQKMVAIARYYYQHNLPRAKIADILGISRQLVSKLLERAVSEGYVNISIVDPFEMNNQLRNRLCKLTGLQDVVIVPSPHKGGEGIKNNIGFVGAPYLIDRIKPGDIIGLGWGRTLRNLIQYLVRKEIPGTKIVPMLGGVGQVEPELQVNNLATVLADKINAKPYLLYALGVVDNKTARDQIIDSISNVLNYWGKIDIALVGIGNVSAEEYTQHSRQVYIPVEERAVMKNKGAVGDINMHFYDIDGKEVVSDKYFKISTSLDQLRRLPLVIGFAGGMFKVKAIQGAIQGKYIDILITDENVAQELVKIYSKNQVLT
jgi:DNA-binding transcriptional regulator LsrR (DeoR family)